jgi:hypothetical protein
MIANTTTSIALADNNRFISPYLLFALRPSPFALCFSYFALPDLFDHEIAKKFPPDKENRDAGSGLCVCPNSSSTASDGFALTTPVCRGRQWHRKRH